jgi:hypothetical protein
MIVFLSGVIFYFGGKMLNQTEAMNKAEQLDVFDEKIKKAKWRVYELERQKKEFIEKETVKIHNLSDGDKCIIAMGVYKKIPNLCVHSNWGTIETLDLLDNRRNFFKGDTRVIPFKSDGV